MKLVPKKLPPLPAGITAADLVYPKTRAKGARVEHAIEMWFTRNYGWCIPTLQIRNAPRGRSYSTDRRSYAVSMTGQVLCVGLGPHIEATITVYIRESRAAALQFLLDLRTKGSADAQNIRDRISTRRANTIARRSYGGFLGL